MFQQKIFLFLVIITLVYFKNFIINLSIYIQLIGLLFILVLYHTHNKFVLFCKDKFNNIRKEKETHYCSFSKNSNSINGISSPFLEACKRGDNNLVRQLINLGVNVYETDKNGDGAIHYAVYDLINNPEKLNVSCLWTLYNIGCPVNLKNRKGLTPLHLAAASGHVLLIKWLIRKGADITIEPIPFLIAFNNGHKQAAAMLLAKEYGIPPWSNEDE